MGKHDFQDRSGVCLSLFRFTRNVATPINTPAEPNMIPIISKVLLFAGGSGAIGPASSTVGLLVADGSGMGEDVADGVY